MNKGIRATYLYIMLGLLLILLIFTLRDSFNGRSDITARELDSMLKSGKVSMIEIVQNEEVPTGSLKITTTDNQELSLNVTDVNAAVQKVSDYDVTVRVQDISRRSTLFSTFLPVLLTGLMVLFLFMMLNRQSGGGSMMMNFGKSRAKVGNLASQLSGDLHAALYKCLERLTIFIRTERVFAALFVLLRLCGRAGKRTDNLDVVAYSVCGRGLDGSTSLHHSRSCFHVAVREHGFVLFDGFFDRAQLIDTAIGRERTFNQFVDFCENLFSVHVLTS